MTASTSGILGNAAVGGNMPTVVSPMPTGSGAIVVHNMLAAALPGYRVRSYPSLLEYFFPAMKLLSVEQADVLHSTPDHGVLFAKQGRPFVATFHNYLLDGVMRPYSNWKQRLHYQTDLRYLTLKSLERADVVTAVSQFTADLVDEELGYDGRIEVIYNAVDTEVFSPVADRRKDGPFVALFCGNLSVRKGVQWLPEIAQGFSKEVKLRCAAARPSRPPKVKNIEFIQGVSRSDMPFVYQSADALLLPTVREGMSLAILEAMACGLPVVASICSSVEECVHDERGGILCDVGDVECFSAAINRLAADRELCLQMGEYNRRLICEQFDLSQMVASYAAVFQRVANEGF